MAAPADDVLRVWRKLHDCALAHGAISVGVACAALALLAGCSTNASGVLSASDLPSEWGLHGTTAAPSDPLTRRLLATVTRPSSGCHGSKVAFFAPAGRAFVFVSAGQPVPFTEVLSYAQTCGSDTNARSDFDDLRRVAQSVSGIGDEALIASFTNKNERNVQVVWRKGQVLGSVMVQGPPHNVRITPTAVTRLAKRAAGGA